MEIRFIAREGSALKRLIVAARSNKSTPSDALHELAARDEARNQMLEREKS